MERQNKIIFHVSGQLHTVDSGDVTPETTLNAYLRDKSNLKGTKRMCLEAGCGVCIVAVEITASQKVIAVNSCLVSIFSCHGWKIHTIEGIGGPPKEYHPIQKLLANFNGSQCGYCSPGMVMNMFALSEDGPVTMQRIEDSFGGNICRCTGYRPILSGFKTLASDCDKRLIGTCNDIEEYIPCPKTLDKCHMECLALKNTFYYNIGDSNRWVKVYYLVDLLSVLRKRDNKTYMMVAGNTARGVYRLTVLPEEYIDISEVQELSHVFIRDNYLYVGANTTLNHTIDLFKETAKGNSKFSHLAQMAAHIELVATVPVRNIGTIAGNLMLKHTHPEFPSDIFLLLETANANLVIVGLDGNEDIMSPAKFLNYDMTGKVLKQIILPELDDTYKFGSYKIMPRAQNAHAMLNAGFLFKLENNTVKTANIVYGGINPKFVHATKTEELLDGINLFTNASFQKAFASLNGELDPDYVLPDPTPKFRKQLAISLLYKYFLSIAPNNFVTSKNKSGATILVRPISSGTQKYETNESIYPLTKPIIKLEAMAQTSGRAEYTTDIPDLPFQLFAAFVVAKATPYSVIKSINTKKALALKDVVRFFGKEDIPGENNFMPPMLSKNNTTVEEIFCTGTVKYFNQPVGLIVAETLEIAQKAAELVEITFSKPTKTPLFTIRDILRANDRSKIHLESTHTAKRTGKDMYKNFKGSFDIFMQYHYYMELQCCNIVPIEDGLNIFPATQHIDQTQTSAATALNIPVNKINVTVRRLGGAFGGKISRNGLLTTAASIAAFKLQKPIKMWMTIEENMEIIGKRYPFSLDYEAGISKDGVIQYLNTELYDDYGTGGNENVDFMVYGNFVAYYVVDTWNVKSYTTRTDNAAGTWARAPGTLESFAGLETIMEELAYKLNMDPLELRLKNLDRVKHPKLIEMINEMKTWANVEKKMSDIKKFNSENRWRKKGISVLPMNFNMEHPLAYSVFITVYHGDGSVAISHGGIEMGQGINTKVAQVCAHKLGIPLEKVSIKPTNSLATANSNTSGGSVTTETVCLALLRACDNLLEKMKPVKDKMKNASWEQIVSKCFDQYIEMTATSVAYPGLPELHLYNVYGVCTAEVDVDILTGQHIVTDVHVMVDAGQSMSPLLDVGQVEGAFVMGIGYFTTEQIIFDEKGELKTNRTWNYKPPGAKDIPVNFHVRLPKGDNPLGVLNSKAIAEAPLCLSLSIPFALRNALSSARMDADNSKDNWYPIYGPSTVENTYLNTLNDFTQYVL